MMIKCVNVYFEFFYTRNGENNFAFSLFTEIFCSLEKRVNFKNF